MIVFTILYALSCFVVFPFLSLSARFNYIRGWSFGIIQSLRWICGVQYTVQGMENITAMMNEPVILMSKHQSAWETIAYLNIMPKQLCYVFKKELLYIPFFGWAMAMLRMIHIDRAKRDKASQAVSLQGSQRLAEGCWIIIYPEGTRCPVGKQIPYRKGGARLAVDTKAFIIPIAQNAGHCWPKNSFLKFPGHITVSIGPVIPTKDKNPSDLILEIEQWIETEMRVIDAGAYQALT
jgi:1-acyl-sn-glycerol-3-phosphate acyltransferase